MPSNEMKKLFIVVLYKQSIASCKTLLAYKNIGLFANPDNFFVIWDNSPGNENEIFPCADFFTCSNIEYIHSPENISLAKIYNQSIKNHFADVYCLFDQDSSINCKDYDQYLDSMLSMYDSVNVFVPQIFSNGRLFSPGKSFLSHGSHFQKLNPGCHKNSFYTAITSGMIVRSRVFFERNIWFNESLNLYGIDFDFFRRYRQVDPYFYLLDITLDHDLSTFTSSDDQEVKARMENQLAAYLIMFKHSVFYPLVWLHGKIVRMKLSKN